MLQLALVKKQPTSPANAQPLQNSQRDNDSKMLREENTQLRDQIKQFEVMMQKMQSEMNLLRSSHHKMHQSDASGEAVYQSFSSQQQSTQSTAVDASDDVSSEAVYHQSTQSADIDVSDDDASADASDEAVYQSFSSQQQSTQSTAVDASDDVSSEAVYHQSTQSADIDVSDDDASADASDEAVYQSFSSQQQSTQSTDVDASADASGEAVYHQSTQSADIDVSDDESGETVYEFVASQQQSTTAHASAKKKPARPCPFCNKMLPRLSRHMLTVHKEHREVKKASSLPPKARDKQLKQLRRQGIFHYNKKQFLSNTPELLRERRRKEDSRVVMCTHCNGFFSRAHFWRHKQKCQADSADDPLAIPVELMKPLSDNTHTNVPVEFRDNVLRKFSNDEAGRMCLTDKSIVIVGRRLYDKMKRKQDKLSEVAKSVRMDMRRLATLFITFKQVVGNNCEHEDASSMLVRSNFQALEDAINIRCTEHEQEGDEGLKAGLKISYYYLIKKFAKIVKVTHLQSGEDHKAAEVDKFTDVLALNHNILFGDALYKINKRRQTKLRRPENLPQEEDCQKLRDYTLKRMSELTADEYRVWSSTDYCELRDLVLSRLTLFNARRGGEPARLTMAEWQEAVADSWLDSTAVADSSDVDKELFKEFKITYQTGKGNNHLVPILFPSDTISAMEKLTDSTVRNFAGIHHNNLYTFPNSKHSMDHVSGWHSVHRVSTDANIKCPELLNPTKMRHLVSTLYAARDVPEQDRRLFYLHMGHSEKVNTAIYQAPLSHQEVTKVGFHLQQIDQSKQAWLIFLKL